MALAMAGGGRNIGVAVDFSARSKNALRWAATTNLAAAGDRLVLVHVKTSYRYEEGVVNLWGRDGSRT
jgi:nucleotide-binding universal stress UspA family protein